MGRSACRRGRRRRCRWGGKHSEFQRGQTHPPRATRRGSGRRGFGGGSLGAAIRHPGARVTGSDSDARNAFAELAADRPSAQHGAEGRTEPLAGTRTTDRPFVASPRGRRKV